ncbi:MAG: gliding motility lipoprotein GldH [Draconibacterium sp.]|nr:gliding motility lipoprotein GldH [Draconibacterium sp.]
MKRFIQFLVYIVVIGLATACDSNRVFDEYKTIQNGLWHKDSLVVFSVPVTDTIQNHNLYINIRNDINYGYSNLWLFIEIVQPKGIAVKDTFEIVLADPTGQWLGEGMGGLKTRQSVYRRNVYFPNSGDYKITIQQGMREDELEGISDVGFRAEITE